MAEYIKREYAIDAVLDVYYDTPDIDLSGEKFEAAILKIQAADVAPFCHGRWEAMHYEGGILDGTNFDKCSVCGYERIFEDEKLKTAFNYCPNCGTLMDLEDE